MKKTVVAGRSAGAPGSVEARRAPMMRRRAASLLVFASLAAFPAQEARAQTSGSLGPLFGAVVAVEGTLVGGGLVTGVGSSVYVAKGEPRTGWFAASYVFGALNLAGTIFLSWSAERGEGVSALEGLAIAHGSLAAFDIVMPTIGLARGARATRELQAGWTPVVVGGVDAGGQRWAGLGVQLSGF